MPGTHSKWVQVEKGEIVGFSTSMTGEAHGLLMIHSILGKVGADQSADPEAFRRGVSAGQANGSLLSRIFSARALGLTERLAAGSTSDYLSGLLIADEVKGMLPDVPASVQIIGRGDLAERYKTVLDLMGVEAGIAAPGMARRGLWEVAKRVGMI